MIAFGPFTYPTKQAAKEALRSVLYRYHTGDTVSAADAQLLAAVLQSHPERAIKMGVGVASFQVEQNDGSRGFWLTRTDGSRTDWSFYSCLTAPTTTSDAAAAFRAEIRDQITAFKRRAFAQGVVMCPVTGTPLTFATAHVDHVHPFEILLRAFLKARHRRFADIVVEPSRDRETANRLTDRDLAEAWRAYHWEHAVLMVVSAKANLSVLRRWRKVHA